MENKIPLLPKSDTTTDVKDVKMDHIETTNEKTADDLVRSCTYLAKNAKTIYHDAYEACNANQMDPYATFFIKSEEFFKTVFKALKSRPNIVKNTLSKSIIDSMLEMRHSMVTSGQVPSLSLSKAKEASLALHKIHSDLDLMCGLQYISNNFYYKLYTDIIELNTLLQKWFEILKKHGAK